MKHELPWKTAEIVLGILGAALLVLILVLKIMGKDVTALTYPIIAIVILFLICDEIARTIVRRREKEEAARKPSEQQKEPETAMPKDAFEFKGEAEGTKR